MYARQGTRWTGKNLLFSRKPSHILQVSFAIPHTENAITFSRNIVMLLSSVWVFVLCVRVCVCDVYSSALNPDMFFFHWVGVFIIGSGGRVLIHQLCSESRRKEIDDNVKRKRTPKNSKLLNEGNAIFLHTILHTFLLNVMYGLWTK